MVRAKERRSESDNQRTLRSCQVPERGLFWSGVGHSRANRPQGTSCLVVLLNVTKDGHHLSGDAP
jgi:hypothetical protein